MHLTAATFGRKHVDTQNYSFGVLSAMYVRMSVVGQRVTIDFPSWDEGLGGFGWVWWVLVTGSKTYGHVAMHNKPRIGAIRCESTRQERADVLSR